MTTLKRRTSWKLRKINNTLSGNTEEVFQLRNHNKILLTKKIIQKLERHNEDVEGKTFGKQEENHYVRNINQEREEKIKKLEDNEQSQE